MLYDSTKVLLQGILRSLETGGEVQWDDQRESGNACLYEMHQMAGRLYKPYKSDTPAGSPAVGTVSERLTRAVPHVRNMVVAIRLKDRERALESGRTALAEMNGLSRPAAVVVPIAPHPVAVPTPAPVAVHPPKKAVRKSRLAVARKKPRVRAAGAK